MFTGGSGFPVSRGGRDTSLCETGSLTPRCWLGSFAAMSETGPDGEPARIARRLLRSEQRGTLATSMRGAPYASLVLITADLDASPLLLLSDLAQHSRNIAFDPRVSILVDGTAGYQDPLTGPRLTVIGQVGATEDPRLLARFTAHHPASASYAGFADFRIYRMAVAGGHLVAGFGRIHRLGSQDLLLAADAALAGAEQDILRHMNEQHADAINDYARVLLARSGTGWQMAGIDPEGADLRWDGETARLDFPSLVLSPEAARSALVELARRARQ